MCCSTKEGVFTWISAFLVNVAFWSLITWGANKYWPIGMVLTAIYTLILLTIATKIDAKQRPTTSGSAGLADNEEIELEDGDGTSQYRIEKVIMDDDLDLSIVSVKREDVSSLVNLLYFLSVISLGVTGFFLVVNLIPSCDNASAFISGSYSSNFSWKADLETIPSSLHNWATSDQWLQPEVDGNSFAYVRSTGITLFQGNSNNPFATGLTKSPSSTSSMYQEIGSSPYIWKVGSVGPPTLVEEGFLFLGPSMATVTDDAVCFSAIANVNSKDMSQRKEPTMYCSNGVDFRREIFDDTVAMQGIQAHLAPLTAFNPVDGILWIKEVDSGEVSGSKIFSLDPVTMISTLHSYKVQDSTSHIIDSDNSCDESHLNRIIAIVSLFASVLPMTAMTFLLGKKTKVPSMGLLAYVCISLVYICLQILVSPNEVGYMDSDFRVWLAVSGLACLLLSTYFLLTLQQHDSNAPRCVDKSHEKQFRSLLGISAVAFSWGTVVLFADFFADRETFGVWVLFNLLVFCPLLLLGAATDSTCVLALGGLGFLADALRLASLIDSVLFFFLVFSLMGLLVGLLGYYFVVQLQPIVQKWALQQVTIINNKCCRASSDPYGLDEYEYGDEDTSPLATVTVNPTSVSD